MGSLVALANRRIPFATACRWAGVEIPGGVTERGLKVHCPFGEYAHSDGGKEAAFRVYPDHGYCVDMETEILSTRGWLRGDQVECGDTVLTYRDQATRWEPVLAVVRFPAARRRMLSMETKTHSSLTTEDHRWMVRRSPSPPSGRPKPGSLEAVPWERFTTSAAGFRVDDRIPYIGGPCVTLPEQPRYSDSFVELIGWFFTEGHIWKSGGVPAGISIHQSHKVNPGNCKRIRDALTVCYGPPSETIRRTHGWREAVRAKKGMTEFILSTAISGQLLEVAPGRVVRPEFITALTREQLCLFTETALDADGARVGNWRQLCQKDRERLDGFQMAMLLRGVPARIWHRENAGAYNGRTVADWACQLLNSAGFSPRYWERAGRVQWVEHDGPVWCVQTPSGTWVARRRGSVYVTGNCFACGESFRGVKLCALAWDCMPDEAARQMLEMAGIADPDYREHWKRSMNWSQPPDVDELAAALRVWCSRTDPRWPVRQYEDVVAVRFSECLGLLSRVRGESDCRVWLEGCKKAMAQVLS